MITASRGKTHSPMIMALVLGLGAAFSAILIAELKVGTALLVMGALAFGVIAFYFAGKETLVHLSLIFLALGIPFNLDVNFFLRAHVGVASVDVGISLVCAIALYVLLFYNHYTSGRGMLPFHYNRALFWMLILYILIGTLSLYNAASAELVVLELVRLGMLFVIFFIVMNLQDRKQIDTFIFALSVGVLLQALIAYYQYKTGGFLGLEVFGERPVAREETGLRLFRGIGTIGHGNMLAYYFEILLPLLFGVFMVEKRPFLKSWYLFVLVTGLIGMVTTQSRGGWLTMPVALPLVFFMLMRHSLSSRKFWIGLFVGLAGLFAIMVVFYPTVERRLTGPDYGSAASREPLNKAAFSVIEQYPVLGVGLNNLSKVFKAYDTTGGSSMFRTSTHVVHNLYLGVWAETGTLGLMAFVGMFLGTLVVAAITIARVAPWQQGILVGASAGLIAQLIHGFVDPGFRIIMSVSMLVYVMFGLVGAMAILGRDEIVKP